MTVLTGAELVAELRRIAELVPTSDAGVAMLAAAQQLELVREWADRNADRDTGDGGRDTEFGQGYRRGAEWARWLLGGPQPTVMHYGADWPQPAPVMPVMRSLPVCGPPPLGWADPQSDPLGDILEWNRRTGDGQ